MHSLVDADVHQSVAAKVVEVVFLDDLSWDNVDVKSHKLWPVRWRV